MGADAAKWLEVEMRVCGNSPLFQFISKVGSKEIS